MRKLFVLFTLLWLAAFLSQASAVGIMVTTGGHVTNPPVLAQAAPVWRGVGNGGMGFTPTSPIFAGGTNWSQTTRYPFYSPVAFSKVRVVLPTFYPQRPGGAGTPVYDVDFANDFNFNVGFEYPYVLGTTGIPNRTHFKFSGSDTGSYTAAGGPYGYLMSDILDLGQTIPANAKYGLWTTIENNDGVISASNTLPMNILSNNLERYIGYTAGTSSQISAGTAFTASSITHIGNSVAGYSEGYIPFMMLILMDPSNKVVGIWGDCICNGVAEGNPTTTADGDADGSQLGDRSFCARYVASLGLGYVNFSIGSDKASYASSGHWNRRLPLWLLANTTDVFSQVGHNDNAGGDGVATMEASIKNGFTLIKNQTPNVKTFQATLTPSSTSTDNWLTVANQTAQANWGVGSHAATLNTAILALAPALGIDGALDANAVVESSAGSGLWKANNVTVQWLVPEGVHPNSLGHATISAGLPAVSPF